MGRYEEKETTSLPLPIPFAPVIYSFEIEDAKTSRIGEGHGYTKQEARDNAWKDLKYGEARYRETPRSPSTSSAGGGGGVSFPISAPADPIVSLGSGLIFGLIVFGIVVAGLAKGCEYLQLQADRGINKIYPVYETREERFLEHTQKWEQWKRFVQGSEKWLLASETTPAMPDGKFIFTAQTNGSRGISLMNLQNKRQIGLTKRFAGEITAYTFSPDGEEIAFVATRRGKNSEIYCMSFNGRKVTIAQVTKTTDGYGYEDLAWLSPSVILATRQVHPYTRTIWQIELSSIPKTPAIVVLRIPTWQEFNEKWVREANKAGRKTFYNCESPTVSPDGAKLAHIKTEYSSFGHMENVIKGAGEIVVRERQNNKESVYDFVNAVRLTPQAWSPNGSQITFSAVDREGKSRVGILELKKPWWPLSKPKVSWLRVIGQNPAWSKDGKWIAFDNKGEIYIFEIATSKAKTEPNSIGCLTGSEVRIVDGNIGRVIKGEKPLWIQ